jgi:putative addiction module component (TIGR02574 family)
MPATLDQILEDVLSLPASQRVQVLYKIQDSLLPPEDHEEESLSDSWKEELLRRSQAFRDGTAETCTKDEFMARMRGAK